MHSSTSRTLSAIFLFTTAACSASDLASSDGESADALSGGPITNLVVGSGKAYAIETSALAVGKNVYIDRTYTFTGVPSSVARGTYIETANDDKVYAAGSTNIMHFTLNVAGTVYVAHDKRFAYPSWLTSGFTDTKSTLDDTDVPRELFEHHYAANSTVTLGANSGAGDTSTNKCMYSVVVVPDVKDTTPPSTPANLAGSPIGSNIVALTWNDSTDNVGVAGYKIFRGTTQLATTLDTNYSDDTAAASTTYSYTVEAYDAAGNVSKASNAAKVTTPASSGTGTAPYPPSSLIGSMTWDMTGRVQDPNGSDLWPITWGSDGNAYTGWGDGGGFRGSNSLGRVSLGFGSVSGNPTGVTTKNIWGGYETENTPTFGGKVDTLISVGGVLYGIGAVFPGTAGVSHSGGADEQRLVYSTNLGKSWSFTSWAFCTETSATVCPGGFINFGKDNAGARDGYVYAYAGSGWWLTDADFNTSYLMRVPNNEVLTQSAWQYFAGLDSSGNATWTSNAANRKPASHDPNGRPIGEAVYNAPLGRYIGVGQGATIGETAFYDAPEPWGPWTTLAYYSDWGSLGTAETLGVHFCNKWTSADGLTMWATFSSTGSLDSFNLAKVTMTRR